MSVCLDLQMCVCIYTYMSIYTYILVRKPVDFQWQIPGIQLFFGRAPTPLSDPVAGLFIEADRQFGSVNLLT